MTTKTVRLYVSKEGKVSFVYDAEFAKALGIGPGTSEVHRASDVEPCGSEWVADMRRVGGPVIGPYADRDTAIAAEIRWLHSNRLGRTVSRPVRWIRQLSRFLPIPRRVLMTTWP